MDRRLKLRRCLPGVLIACLLLSGCGLNAPAPDAQPTEAAQTLPDLAVPSLDETAYVQPVSLEIVSLEAEAVALAELPAVTLGLTPEASATKEKRVDKAVIDYSHTEDGYVMVQYLAATSVRLKVQISGPNTPKLTYTYNLTPQKWEVFPLSDGNGSYKITVYENVSGNKYASVLSLSCDVTLTDEFAPYLRPNQYVDYGAAPNTVAKGAALCKDLSEPLEKVAAVYDYVVTNLSYDKQLAATVKSGYLPVLDSVLEKQTGICFDYAALMTGMLRSQGVPCKLVVGYAGTAYHAWISVWSEDEGWIDGAIWFDGNVWHRMDPTFASSGKQSKTIMSYIGDGKNYTAKYFY